MSLGLRLLRVFPVWCAAVAIVGTAQAQQPAGQQPPAKPPAAKPTLPLPPPGQPGGQNQTLKDPVVAIVNGQPLHLSELEIAQQALPPQYRNVPMQSVFAALLDRIVDSKLVVQEGRKNKVTDDPAFKHRMAFVEDQVIQDFWLQKEIARKVTPEKMHQRYDERLKSMPGEEEVQARHILVATEDEAKALIAQLKKGASFDKLAREKSTDKASGGEGGDLGWFKKSDMVKEFADAAFALKKGEMSDTPVKTQFGYHIILTEDRRKAPPPTFEELSQEIREELAKEAVNGFLNQLRASAKIEKFNIDGSKPAAPPAGQPAAPAAPPGKPATPSGGK
jgi:peptidyl-prolyl cis-trans isomerase C